MKKLIAFTMTGFIGLVFLAMAMSVSAQGFKQNQKFLFEQPEFNNSLKANASARTMEALLEKNEITRGKQAMCQVIIDNSTPWILKTFVNGYYIGAAGPYGRSTFYTYPSNGAVVFARADFTDGSVRNWAPMTFGYCAGGAYIYRNYIP